MLFLHCLLMGIQLMLNSPMISYEFDVLQLCWRFIMQIFQVVRCSYHRMWYKLHEDNSYKPQLIGTVRYASLILPYLGFRLIFDIDRNIYFFGIGDTNTWPNPVRDLCKEFKLIVDIKLISPCHWRPSHWKKYSM